MKDDKKPTDKKKEDDLIEKPEAGSVELEEADQERVSGGLMRNIE